MKITVGMKCPDALDRAIEEAAEREGSYYDSVKKAKQVAAKWFKYSEYIRVTIDTELETCVVEPA